NAVMICVVSGPLALPPHEAHGPRPGCVPVSIWPHADPRAADGRAGLLSAGTCRAGHGGRRGHLARVSDWVWHGRLAPSWPRCHSRSADTKEIGFSRAFFMPRREIVEAAGMAARAVGSP